VLTHALADTYSRDYPVAARMALQARILAQAIGVANSDGSFPGKEEIIDAPTVFFFEPHQPEQSGFTPDVLLDIPNVSVDEIKLDVENLQAHVSLDARVANLVRITAGVDASIDKVHLEIKGVQATALLIVRLMRKPDTLRETHGARLRQALREEQRDGRGGLRQPLDSLFAAQEQRIETFGRRMNALTDRTDARLDVLRLHRGAGAQVLGHGPDRHRVVGRPDQPHPGHHRHGDDRDADPHAGVSPTGCGCAGRWSRRGPERGVHAGHHGRSRRRARTGFPQGGRRSRGSSGSDGSMEA
jgi:hypothetical protein